MAELHSAARAAEYRPRITAVPADNLGACDQDHIRRATDVISQRVRLNLGLSFEALQEDHFHHYLMSLFSCERALLPCLGEIRSDRVREHLHRPRLCGIVIIP